MTITLADYWMGRDVSHGLMLSTETRRNAALTVDLANELMLLAVADGVAMQVSPRTGSQVASGWRPPDINARTKGASKTSHHMTGGGIDLYDPDGAIDAWCMANAETALKKFGLWLEHPSATPKWCHLQTKPPGSGKRVFHP